MKLDGSKFNGNMLRDARIYRGLTITELAERIEMSKQSVSQFENGRSPGADVLLKITRELQFPLKFFFQKDDEQLRSGSTYFRSLASANKRERLAQQSKVKKVCQIYDFFSQYLEFPELDIIRISPEDMGIEKIAMKLREYWNIGNSPIDNIVNLVEKHGIVVSSFKVDTNKIDAFSQRNEKNNKEIYCMILANDKQSAARRNFDVAHELGHIVMHEWNLDIEQLSNEEFREIENQANQFAAAFLMPQKSFLADLICERNLSYYQELKKKWKVSITAMVMRAFQLKRITVNQYQYLMKQISRRGWRIEEPLDSVLPIEQPMLFKRAIKILKDNNILDGNEIIEELNNYGVNLTSDDVENLLNLDKGELSNNNRNNILELVKIKQ